MKSTLHVTIMLSRSIVSTSVVGMSALTNDCAVDFSHKMLNFILNKQYNNAKPQDPRGLALFYCF